MILFLTGFMGSGKTSVGRALAGRLAVPFIDLDRAVEASAGRPIHAIFEDEGEVGFRRREAAALEEELAAARSRNPSGAEPAGSVSRPRRVVALGGGTVVAEGVPERLRQVGLVVWLDVPFAVIERRLSGTGLRSAGPALRPLFRDRERTRRLYEERLPVYRRCDLRIEVGEGEGPDAVAARIEEQLGSTR